MADRHNSEALEASAALARTCAKLFAVVDDLVAADADELPDQAPFGFPRVQSRSE
jgi:hypothetical protein